MPIDDQIEDEKVQYDINKEAAQISALSSKLTSMNILLEKKYYHLIKNK